MAGDFSKNSAGAYPMFSFRLSNRTMQFEALEARTLYSTGPAPEAGQFICASDQTPLTSFHFTESHPDSLVYFPSGAGDHWFRYYTSVNRNGVHVASSQDLAQIDWLHADRYAEARFALSCGLGRVDSGNYSITVAWRRDDGLMGEATISGVIDNDPPKISIDGPDTVSTGDLVSLRAGPPVEPDGKTWDCDTEEDYAAGLTYHIDWDGDGTVDEDFHQPATPGGVDGYSNVFSTLTHQYLEPGSYAVHVTAEDKDGGVSELVTHRIEVTGPDLSPHNNNTPVVPVPVMPTEPQDNPASKGAQKADPPLVRFIATATSKTFTSPFAKTVEFDLDQLTQNNDA